MRQNNSNSRRLLLLLFIFPCFLYAQTTLTGRINDSNGDTVPFANVIEKGTTNGTTSDMDGNFSISVASLPVTLVFSSLGFETVEQQVTTAAAMSVTMAESAESLEEVVITGLASSVKRANAANAVSTVTAEQLVGTTTPVTLDGALYGKFTGAVINANSGAPGGGLSVKLRGATSLQGNTQPLYIVDGVYVDNSSIPAGLNAVSGAAAGGSSAALAQDNAVNRIADINPDDIETVEILKGASAAAIYGSRAAAGVVIITTKRGKSGETKFNFSQSFGWTQALNLLGMRDYTRPRVEASFGEDAANQYQAALSAGTLVDYEEEMYGENGFISNTNFSMTGGDNRTKFFAAASNNNEAGIVLNTGYERTSLRLNVDHRANDWLKFGLSSNYVYSSADRGYFNNDNTGTTIGVTMTGVTPWLQLFPDENGIYPDNPSGASNPLQTRDLITNRETVNRMIMGGSANMDLYKAANSSLELILRGGLDFYGQQSRAIFPKALQFQKPANGGLNGVSIQGDTQNKNYNLSGFLVHNYNTDSGVNFRTQAGLTYENFDMNRQVITASGLVASETNVDQASNVGVDQTRFRQEDSGFFAQEEVNFQNMVIATIGVRGDKSSNNGDSDKLYYYPKGSLAVNLNEMSFWNDGSVWDQFKLRAAYGEAGNFPPPNAIFTSYRAFTTDGQLGLTLGGIRGDANIQPERQKELEFGMDLGFYDGRLNFTATYYTKTIEDLILLAALEPSTGFTQQYTNAGEMENKGIELSLNATPIVTDNFSWDIGINWWKNESEITELGVPAYNVGAFGATLGTYRVEEGQSVTQLVGIGPAELDTNGDGFVVWGDAEPDWQMSMNNVFKYKAFELAFLWHWKEGGDNVNLTTLLSDLSGTTHDYDTIGLDPDGALGNGDYRLSQLGSSAEVFVEDASYIRLREAGLYYTLSGKTLSGVLNGTFDSIKLGFSGTNIINIFDYNSYDPEVSNFGGNTPFTGVEVTPFPSSKRFLFHVSANF